MFFTLTLVFSIDGKHHSTTTHKKRHIITRQHTHDTTRRNTLLPVTSMVADITQSIKFSDREKSLNELAEPIHIQKAAAAHHKIPNLESDVEAESVKPVKRNNIEKDVIPIEDDDDESVDDDNTVVESGSGDETTEEEHKPIHKKTIRKKMAKPVKKCYQKCSTPMTYEQCALPRCSYKIRPIRSLCYALCRNQIKRCVKVCE